jgi:tRNA nucleotidyltransferase (CCA-adding enzyme)
VRRSTRGTGPAARAALDELLARDDASIVGLVLSGSVARGMATERSDVDVYVVRDDDVERETLHSPAIDEAPADGTSGGPSRTPGCFST